MSDRSRRVAAIAMLVASCAAILATTPGEPTARASVEGDVAVGPGRPAEVTVRFVVAPGGPSGMDRGTISFFSDFLANSFSDGFTTPIEQRVVAVADGVELIPEEGTSRLGLPTRVCGDGCEGELRAVLTWTGEPGDSMRAQWVSELSVVYESFVPSGQPVTATIVEGHAPPLGRHLWVMAGALLAALAGGAWVVLGDRLARVRLTVAALGLLPPGWVLAQYLTADLSVLLRFLDYGTLLILLTAVVVFAGLVVGVVRTWRGDTTAMPAAGWGYLVSVGFLGWLAIERFATYRPHEVALLAAGLALPGLAALTAVSPQGPVASARRRFGTSFTMAALLAQFAATAGVAAFLVIGLVVSLVSGRGRLDGGTALLGLIPFAVAAAFMIGFQRWPSGDRRLLGVASTATLLVLIPLLLFVLSGQGGFFVFPVEMAAVLGICFVVNLAGLIGLAIFPPPARVTDAGGASPTQDEGDGERGQRDEVARVADEDDVDRTGDRS